MPRPYQVALLCTAAALAWQWGVVQGAYGGNWSGLFLTGDRFHLSPPVSAEDTYRLHASIGYDGQLYHAIAHDPLDRDSTDRFLDNPRIRYSRILIPALSFALGFGKLFWVDRAYRVLILVSLWLGVFLVAAFARLTARSAWWGAAFLALPATFISLERELTDLPLCALILAALYGAIKERWTWCSLSLAAAALTREMGLVAIAAIAGSVLLNRSQKPAMLNRSIALSLSALPALAWYAYVFRFIPPRGRNPFVYHYPLSSAFQALVHPHFYHALAGPLQVLDAIAIAGMLWAFALGFRASGRDPLAMLAVAFAAFGLISSGSPIVDYTDVYSFARANSSLLLALLLVAIRDARMIWITPFALILPRTLIPIASLTLRSLLTLLRHR